MRTYKYYTPEDLAKFLISLLPQKHYSNVIDICCGSWNLLNAALNLYSELDCVGVDIDINAENDKPDGACFYCCDGRAFAVKAVKKYDLILSNPPFGSLEDEECFFGLTNQSPLLTALGNKRYENEMTWANLLLAHPGSVLLFILPLTFIEGDTYKRAREEITRDYTINWIAKLPENVFGQSGIATYALAITQEGQHKGTTIYWEIYSDEDGWHRKNERQIGQQDVCNGNWSDFQLLPIDDSISIARGKLSSKELKRNGNHGDVKVLHCTGACKDGDWEPVVRYARCNTLRTVEKVARQNDIVICRIGKSAGYWCKNSHGNILISDCILLIPFEKKVFDKLRKCSKDGRLKVPIRGVTTKYITARDIKKILYE